MKMFSEFFKPFIDSFNILFEYWWVILPGLLHWMFRELWMDYVIATSKDSWLSKLKWTVLEIIPPKNIEKSPKVMESFFQGLAGVIAGINPLNRYTKGAFIDRFSLEIVGEEGMMHFYVRTQTKYRNLIEANIYAQFPEAEVVEVPDYVKRFPRVVPNRDWDIWGTDVEFTSKHDIMPIKTYDKFEEDITGTMIDPLAALAEVFSKLPYGQHVWIQFVIDPQPENWFKAHLGVIDELSKKAKQKDLGFFDHVVDVITNVPKSVFSTMEFMSAAAPKADQPLEFKLTPGEKEKLKVVEENFGRNIFRVKMRVVYIGRREGFDKSLGVSGVFGAIKQFNDMNLNGFKPNDPSKTYADYGIMQKERMEFRQRRIYNRYKNRNMDGKNIFMSGKELATVFHFPNMEVKAPSLTQTQSRRGLAPFNLPIE
jgi:hypothetical protein